MKALGPISSPQVAGLPLEREEVAPYGEAACEKGHTQAMVL